METVALALVLTSALMHATWNLLARRSRNPYAFFFCFNAAAIVVWFPFALVAISIDGLGTSALPWILASGALQVAYFVALGSAYSRGGLSIVYPIARGTGVAIVPLAAVVIFEERPSRLAIVGILAVLTGLFLLTAGGLRGRHREPPNQRSAAGFALLTGLIIACYSLFDSRGVREANPLLYGYGLILVAVLLQVPYVLRFRITDIVEEWRGSRMAIVAGGVMSLGTYVLVLFALQAASVGIVVPLRETSIVFGVILGIIVLRERPAYYQLAGAAIVGFGALAVAIGG